MKLNDVELIGVKRCPHCGVADPRLAKYWLSEEIPRADSKPSSRWAAFFCATCGHGILARGRPGDANRSANAEIIALFPQPKVAHGDIPTIARTFLQQAYETLHAPDAAGVMAASAVDAMLKNLGYEEGSLYARIDKAVEDSVLTAGMGKWAHSVRLEANRPRHADKGSPHLAPEEARRSVEFAEALGSFLFVFTKRVERGIQGAEEAETEAAPA